MAKKITRRQRADVDSMLARQDLCETALQQLTRQRDPIQALRRWAIVLGAKEARAFDQLNPTQVGSLLAQAVEASYEIGRYVIQMDSAMSAALAKVKP
jgi:predicted Zn-dependent protease